MLRLLPVLPVGDEVGFTFLISLIVVERFESPNEFRSCFQGQFDHGMNSWGKLVPVEGSESSK